jgi:hypothetical protein
MLLGGGGVAPKVGSATNSEWLFKWDSWDDSGLWGRNEKTGERINVAYGTPVMGWPVWRAIQLPENKVLFQLGDDQLCILNVTGKKVGLFARGHGPVALPFGDSD